MSTITTEMQEFISRVVHDGSNYRMDAMEKLYTDDMAILFPTAQGAIAAAPAGRSSRSSPPGARQARHPCPPSTRSCTPRTRASTRPHSSTVA